MNPASMLLAILLFPTVYARIRLSSSGADRLADGEDAPQPAVQPAAHVTATAARVLGGQGELAPILCTPDEMIRIGAEVNLTMAQMRTSLGMGASLAEASAQKKCTRTRIQPVYANAPELLRRPELGLDPVQHAKLAAVSGEAASASAAGAAGFRFEGVEDVLKLIAPEESADPGLTRYDASESRFDKAGQEEYPNWKETIAQSKKNFYCYLWRSHFRLQDKGTSENVCFPDEIKRRFKRAPTCAFVSHSSDFEKLADYAWRRGHGKGSALQEEIDGHDLVVRFSDHWSNGGAYGRKTNYRVYSKIGSGLQKVPHESGTFEKRTMERNDQNVSDGFLVLWNQGYDNCRDRLEMEAWFKQEAIRSGVPIYTYNPEDLKDLVAGWLEFAYHDPAIRDCIWNDRENKDTFCYRVFHRRYPVATKKSSGFKTPTTGFGAALAFLNVCSKISLYGYSSMALPPMGDMNAHKTSFAEQTLLLKILSEKVDGLAKTEQPSNYTHIHHIQGMHEFFEGKEPEEECRDEYELHLGYPDVTETMGEIPSEGFWGH